MKNKTKIKINFIVTILLLLIMNLNYVLAAAGPVGPQIPQIVNPIASIEVVGDHFNDELTFTVNLQDVRPLTQCAYSVNLKYLNSDENIELFSERISSSGTYSYDSSFNLNMYSLTFTKTIDISNLESGIVDMYLVVVNNTGTSKPHCNQAIHINEGDENNKSILQSKIVQAQKLYDTSTEGINIGQYITGSKIKLQAAIDHAQEVVNDINATEVNVLNAIAKLDSDVADFNSLLIDDMTALQIALLQAIDLYDNSTEGIESGQYKIGTRTKLYTIITHAKQIVNNLSSTVPEKVNVLTELNNAMNDFKASIVKEYIGAKRYDITFQDSGVLELELSNVPTLCNYNIEVYDSNNVLLRKAENLDSTNKKIMCDIPVAGNYYAKIYYKKGFSEGQSYELQLNRKEKFELIEYESDCFSTYLNLKINNPKNIRTGTIVLEYDPAIIKEPGSSASSVIGHPTGLKTVAIKHIIGKTKNKVIFFYDMENDCAKDMTDQSVIIDTIRFDVLKEAVTTISILPESTISWYDSNSYISNKQISMTINTEMSSNSAVLQTIESDPQLAILQNALKEIENQKDIYNPEVSLNPAYSGDIKSFPGLIDNTSNSSIFGNVRVPAGSYIKPEQLIVTLTNGLNEKRSVYPNSIGRFSFENVPAGDYYIKVERNDNLLNITTKKPMIVTNEKHIGSVNGDNCLFVQELGYYYDTDYNNDGHINETDVNEFMDVAKNYSIIEGNILRAPYLDNESKMLNVTPLSTSTDSNTQIPNTSIMPYTSETEQYDSSSDGIINSNDISNTITGGTWNDPKDEGLVDRHNYDAFSIEDTIPNTFKAGEEGTFTIAFKDISQKYSEDIRYLFLDGMTHSGWSVSNGAEYIYYSLKRLDTNKIKTTVINYNITNVDFEHLEWPSIVTFTVKYEVPENIDSESTNLTFRLKHYTDFTFGKPLSKNISITNSNPSPQKPDWYKITTTDSNGRNVEICLSDIGGSGGEKSLITAMVRRENESLWSTYQVIPAGGTYAWIDTGSIYASPPSKNGYEAVTIAEIPFIDDIVDSINKKKEEIINDFYAKIGIDPNVLTDEDKDMLLQGVYYGIDDNVFFGAVQWVRHNKPFDDNYYFMRSKLYTDAIFTAAYTASTVGSAAEAVRALSTAGASGAMSLATAPTGGGVVVFGAAAVTELAESAIMSGVSFISGKMAKRSQGILIKDAQKLKDIIAEALTKLRFKPGYAEHLKSFVKFDRDVTKGLTGCHNMDEFYKYFREVEGLADSDFIQSVTKHPNPKFKEMIQQIEYKVPVKEGKPPVIVPGKYKVFQKPKTVYNPKLVSDADILKWGEEAMRNGIANNTIQGSKITGTASNGLKFEGWINRSVTNATEITNFYPILD